MNTREQEEMERLLKQSLPPIGAQPGADLQRDLWPALLRRLDERPAAVPWFDWAVLAALAVGLAIFPRAIPVLLYHL